MPASDDLRMERQVVEPAGAIRVRPVELAAPDLLDLRRRGEPRVRAENELERREVVEAPRDRQLDEPRLLAEHVGPVRRPAIAAPYPVGMEVAPHEARVPFETVFDEEADRPRAQVP